MTSASERLRTLGEDNRDPALMIGAALLVMDALPLIADVVEAAEKMRHEYQQDMDNWSVAEYDGSPAHGLADDFDSSLTALRDALEEK